MKYVRTALVCLILPGLGIAQTIELRTPHTGDTKISGKVTGGQGPGTVVKGARTHADGHSEPFTAVTADQKGNFTALLPTSDKLVSGDKVSATAVPAAGAAATAAPAHAALPAVVEVSATTPPIIRFASSLSQTRGAALHVTISSDSAWPDALLGDKTVTVVADDALQYADGTTATGDLPLANTLQVALSTATPDTNTATAPVEDALCDWGRVRCYVYFGTIFSQTNGEFSKTDPYLDFNVEWNWLKGRHGILTGFFDTRLTTIPAPGTPDPTASSTTTATTPTSTTTTTTATTPTPSAADAFASSSKSLQVSGGFYYAPWVKPVWSVKDDQYGMFAASIYKGGIQGRLDGATDPKNLAFPNQGKSVFTFNAAGGRLGFVKFHPGDGDAHELLSYIDFTVGKYRLYDYVGPDFQGAPGGGASDVRHFGLRKVFEARIKIPIPSVNLRLGMDANLGQGQNDLRFLVTTNAIDIFRSLVGQK